MRIQHQTDAVPLLNIHHRHPHRLNSAVKHTGLNYSTGNYQIKAELHKHTKPYMDKVNQEQETPRRTLPYKPMHTCVHTPHKSDQKKKKKPTQAFHSTAKPKVKQPLKEQMSHSRITTQRMREESFIIHPSTPDRITVLLPV